MPLDSLIGLVYRLLVKHTPVRLRNTYHSVGRVGCHQAEPWQAFRDRFKAGTWGSIAQSRKSLCNDRGLDDQIEEPNAVLYPHPVGCSTHQIQV